jgi:hypothetical protein
VLITSFLTFLPAACPVDKKEILAAQDSCYSPGLRQSALRVMYPAPFMGTIICLESISKFNILDMRSASVGSAPRVEAF